MPIPSGKNRPFNRVILKTVEARYDQVAKCCKQTIALTHGKYIEARNWLRTTRQLK